MAQITLTLVQDELLTVRIPRKSEGCIMLDQSEVKQLRQLLKCKRWQDCVGLRHLASILRQY